MPTLTLVKIRTVYGDFVHVSQSDLDGDKILLPMYTAKGERKSGEQTRIHRENLVHGSVELSDTAKFEDTMKASGNWKIAKFPKTQKQATKLILDGFLPYVEGSEGEPLAHILGVVYAKPTQGATA